MPLCSARFQFILSFWVGLRDPEQGPEILADRNRETVQYRSGRTRQNKRLQKSAASEIRRPVLHHRSTNAVPVFAETAAPLGTSVAPTGTLAVGQNQKSR